MCDRGTGVTRGQALCHSIVTECLSPCHTTECLSHCHTVTPFLSTLGLYLVF